MLTRILATGLTNENVVGALTIGVAIMGDYMGHRLSSPVKAQENQPSQTNNPNTFFNSNSRIHFDEFFIQDICSPR